MWFHSLPPRAVDASVCQMFIVPSRANMKGLAFSQVCKMAHVSSLADADWRRGSIHVATVLPVRKGWPRKGSQWKGTLAGHCWHSIQLLVPFIAARVLGLRVARGRGKRSALASAATPTATQYCNDESLGASISEGRTSLPSRRRTISDLLEWLESGGAQGLSGIRVKPSAGSCAGIGVFAKRSFRTAELVVSIPRRLCLYAEEDDPSISQVSDPEVRLALALLRELHSDARSRFAAYLADLTRSGSLSLHPLMWQTGLTPSNSFNASPRATRLIRLARLRGLARSNALMATSLPRSEREARWALAIVETRSFAINGPNDARQLALCPLLDLLNHHTSEQGVSWACRFHRAADGSLRMLADRPIRKAEELCHLYAASCSAQLFATYGFVTPPSDDGSPFEKCGLLIPVHEFCGGSTDVARARTDALRSRGWLRGSKATRPIVLTLPSDAELGGRLLPIARLAAIATAEDVRRLEPDLFSACEIPDDNICKRPPQNLGIDLEDKAREFVVTWTELAMAHIDAEHVRLTRLESPCIQDKMAGWLLQAERDVLSLEREAARSFRADVAEARNIAKEAAGTGQSFEAALERAYAQVNAKYWSDVDGWMGAG